jgi:hypothetical protein
MRHRKVTKEIKEFFSRGMIAQVSRVERVGDGERGRTSFEFDAIEEAAAVNLNLADLFRSDNTTPFASVRILTTTKKIGEVFDVVPVVGDWCRLQLEPPMPAKWPSRLRLPAWHSPLTDEGYNFHRKVYAVDLRFLFSGGERLPRELGAGVDDQLALRKRVARASRFPTAAVARRKSVKDLLNSVQRPAFTIVHDVGQAGFVSLTNAHVPLVHYDVGWPISYNRHTALQKKKIRLAHAPVVLSHWDWDHVHGYYKFPAIRSCKWIVPVQQLGPGAARVATRLHADGNLLGFKGRPISFKSGQMSCTRFG